MAIRMRIRPMNTGGLSNVKRKKKSQGNKDVGFILQGSAARHLRILSSAIGPKGSKHCRVHERRKKRRMRRGGGAEGPSDL